MSPEVKPNSGQGENPQILREETIVPKTIRFDTEMLSGKRLVTSLCDLGVKVLSGHVNVRNASPFKRTYFTEDHFIAENMGMEITTGKSDTDIPVGNVFGSGELIVEDPPFGRSSIMNRSSSLIDTNLRFNNQPVRMHTAHELRDKDSHRLSLVMPVTIFAKREVLLESIPFDFTTAAFSYDFVRSPEHRNRLSAIAQKRVPAKVVRGGTARGEITPTGVDTQIQLNLQNSNPAKHLRCYEVEIFAGGITEGVITNVPQETMARVAPKAIWQPKENHYCEIGESFSFIPVELNEMSRLKMEINGEHISPKVMADLLSDLPLSIDGTNQWYVETANLEESLGLFFKPEWGEKNAALVFNKVSSKRISPKQIHGALVRMDTLRKSLTERLSA